MRPLALAAVALAATAAGCSFNDCRFPAPTRQTAAGQSVRAQLTSAPDTLVVAYTQAEGADVFELRAGTPALVPSGALTAELTATVEALGAAVPTLDAAVRGDTLFVRPASPFALRACSPPLSEVVATLTQAAVPDGVRALRVVGLPAGYRLPDFDGPPRRAALTRA